MTFVSPPGGWLWRAILGTGLSQLALGIARPALSYATLDMGGDGLAIGVLAAVHGVIPMLCVVPLGSLLGRLARIAVVPLVASIVMAFGCVVAAFATQPWMLVVASALLGAGGVGVNLGSQGWITRSAPPRLYNSGFGWMAAGGALGQATGPLITGIAIGPVSTNRVGITAAFWIAAGVAALLATVFISRAVRHYSGDSAVERSPLNVILRSPGVGRYMFISAMVLTSVDILTAYLPLLGEARGISPAAVGALLGVRGVASMVSRIFLGRLAARWSTSALILWSTAGSAVAVLTVALTTNPIPLSIAMVIGGFFLGMAQPLTITVVIAALQPRDRTQGLALRMFGNHLAQTAVPLLAGVAALAIGPSSAFLAQGAALAVSTAWETLARRNGGDHKRSNS